MTPPSALSQAGARMAANPDDAAARMDVYRLLAVTDLYLVLAAEADGDRIRPEMFDTGDGPMVLAFDSQAAMVAFTGSVVPFAALQGRVLAQLLAGPDAGHRIGLVVNPGDGDAAIVLPPDGLVWLADLAATVEDPEPAETRFRSVSAPVGLPQDVLTAIDACLARAGGLADCAYLAAVEDSRGDTAHLLALVDAVPDAQPALTRALNQVLAFAGEGAGPVHVGFFDRSEAVVAVFARHGLRFDLPAPGDASKGERPAPGSDPDAPPILR
ncbi:MAG: SseB family protein [Marinibacterium sp.]